MCAECGGGNGSTNVGGKVDGHPREGVPDVPCKGTRAIGDMSA